MSLIEDKCSKILFKDILKDLDSRNFNSDFLKSIKNKIKTIYSSIQNNNEEKVNNFENVYNNIIKISNFINSNDIKNLKNSLSLNILKNGFIPYDILLDSIDSPNSSQDLIEYCINLYKNLNYEIDIYKNYVPLFVAVNKNNFSVADYLINKSANIQYKNKYNQNIFLYLLERNINQENLKYIYDKGIDITSKFNINYLKFPTSNSIDTELAKISSFFCLDNLKIEDKNITCFDYIIYTYFYNENYIGIRDKEKGKFALKLLLFIIKLEDFNINNINGKSIQLIVSCKLYKIINAFISYKSDFIKSNLFQKILSMVLIVKDYYILDYLLEKINDNDIIYKILFKIVKYSNNQDVMKTVNNLLNKNIIDINKCYNDKYLINLSIKYGNDELTKILINNNANINIRDKLGNSLLMNAVKYDLSPETVKLLCYKGCEIFTYSDIESCMNYAREYDIDSYPFLLKYLSKLDEENRNIQDVLLNSFNKKDFKPIKYLKSNDIKIIIDDIKNNEDIYNYVGYYPLHIGCLFNNIDLVSVLIQYNYNVNTKASINMRIIRKLQRRTYFRPDIMRDTIINQLIRSRVRNETLYRLLLKAGAYIESRYFKDNNDCAYLIENNKDLLEAISIIDNFNILEEYGHTTTVIYNPVIYFITLCRNEIVESLLSKYSNLIEKPDENGFTPIFQSIKCCNIRIFNFLINNYKINLARKNKLGQTPLMYAKQLRKEKKNNILDDIINKLETFEFINIPDVIPFQNILKDINTNIINSKTEFSRILYEEIKNKYNSLSLTSNPLYEKKFEHDYNFVVILSNLIKENNLNDLKSFVENNSLSITDLRENLQYDLLLDAIDNNSNEDIIEYCIGLTDDLNYSVNKLFIPLYHAIKNNNFKIADKLIEKKADINYLNGNLGNILCYLLMDYINRDNLSYILKHDIKINYNLYRNNMISLSTFPNNETESELKISEYFNPTNLIGGVSITCFDYLLYEYGILNNQTEDENNILSLLQLIISHKNFDLNAINKKSIELMINHKLYDIIDSLFQQNLAQNIKDFSSYALLYASKIMDITILKYLLEKMNDDYIKNYSGNKLMFDFLNYTYNENSEKFDLIQILSNKGININYNLIEDNQSLSIPVLDEKEYQYVKLFFNPDDLPNSNITYFDYFIYQSINFEKNQKKNKYLEFAQEVIQFENFDIKNINEKSIKLLIKHKYYNILERIVQTKQDFINSHLSLCALEFASKIRDIYILNYLLEKIDNSCIVKENIGVKLIIEILYYPNNYSEEKVQLIKKLMNKGIDINDTKIHTGTYILIDAIKSKDENLTEFLINNGAKVDIADNQKITPLMYAIKYNFNINIIKLLIKYYKDPEWKDINNHSILDYALTYNNDNAELLQLIEKIYPSNNQINDVPTVPNQPLINNSIISNNFDKTSRDDKNSNIISLHDIIKTSKIQKEEKLFSLHNACLLNDFVLMKNLIKSNYNINLKNSYTNETALMFSIKNLKYEAARVLLSYDDIDVDIPDQYNETPLLYMIKNKKTSNYEIFKNLILHGANIYNEYNGVIPIKLLVKQKMCNYLKFVMMQPSFNVLKLYENKSLLDIMIENNCIDDELIKLLCKDIVFINLSQYDKKAFKRIENNSLLIKLILQKKLYTFDENTKSMVYVTTPLLHIMEYNNFGIIKALLKNGANVEESDKITGNRPIYKAIEKENFDLFKLLIKTYHVNIIKSNKLHQTPLMYVLELKNQFKKKKAGKLNNFISYLVQLNKENSSSLSKLTTENIISNNFRKNEGTNSNNNKGNSNKSNNKIVLEPVKQKIENHNTIILNNNNSNIVNNNNNNVVERPVKPKIENNDTVITNNNNNDDDDDDDVVQGPVKPKIKNNDIVITNNDNNIVSKPIKPKIEGNDTVISNNNNIILNLAKPKIENNDTILSKEENIYNDTDVPLLNNLPNIENIDIKNYSEFHLACLSSNIEFIKLFIEEYEYDVNESSHHDGSTGLLLAINKGKYQNVQELLKYNASITKENNEHETPLSFVLKNPSDQNNKILKCLIESPEFNMNQTYPPDNLTPLYYTVKYNNPKGIEILSKRNGFDINEINEEGDTPLTYLVKGSSNSSNVSIEMVETLLSLGANINYCNKDDKNSLLYALEQGNIKLGELLIKYNVDVNYKYKNGLTPLKHAIKYHNLAFGKMLLDVKIKI